LHVEILSEGLETELLESLKRTFRKHPGKSELMFHLKTPRHGEIVVRAGEDYRVTPSRELEVLVEDLLEENAVDYEVRPYQPSEGGNGRRERWRKARNGD
jgi:hypothetical protein